MRGWHVVREIESFARPPNLGSWHAVKAAFSHGASSISTPCLFHTSLLKIDHVRFRAPTLRRAWIPNRCCTRPEAEAKSMEQAATLALPTLWYLRVRHHCPFSNPSDSRRMKNRAGCPARSPDLLSGPVYPLGSLVVQRDPAPPQPVVVPPRRAGQTRSQSGRGRCE